MEAGLAALAELGWNPPPKLRRSTLLEKIFLKKPNLLKGDLVEPELSDNRRPARHRVPTGAITSTGCNGRRARRTTRCRRQEGFADDVPTALLYLLLHHALDLGYIDTDLELRRDSAANERCRLQASIARSPSSFRWRRATHAQPLGEPLSPGAGGHQRPGAAHG